MQAQLTGAMKKAELEASQKLLSVLPYQTGQVIARPNANAIRRHQIDRHSFALGDTEEYDRLFSRIPGDYMRNQNGNFLKDNNNLQQQRGIFDHHTPSSRPKSVIEGNNDLSSIFHNDWSYGGFGSGHSQQQQQQQQSRNTVGANRPKSADISSWSFGITSSVSSKSVRDGNKDSLASPWSGLSPTVATLGEKQQQQQQQLHQHQQNTMTSEMDQQLSMMANNWSLGGGGGGINGINGNNRSSIILSDDTNGFRRRTTAMNRTSIPGTVPETADEHFSKHHVQSPPMTPAPATIINSPTNIVLSLYDESATAPSTSTQLFGNGNAEVTNTPYYMAQQQQQQQQQTPSHIESPVPSQSNSMSLFNTTNILNAPQPPKQHNFGQFLNPNDRVATNDSVETGYYSDHSDTSNRSNGSKSNYSKKKVSGNTHCAGNNVSNGGYHNSNAPRNGAGGGNAKDKKNIDVVDMNLLEGMLCKYLARRTC
jgi:hypothetical protein